MKAWTTGALCALTAFFGIASASVTAEGLKRAMGEAGITPVETQDGGEGLSALIGEGPMGTPVVLTMLDIDGDEAAELVVLMTAQAIRENPPYAVLNQYNTNSATTLFISEGRGMMAFPMVTVGEMDDATLVASMQLFLSEVPVFAQAVAPYAGMDLGTSVGLRPESIGAGGTMTLAEIAARDEALTTRLNRAGLGAAETALPSAAIDRPALLEAAFARTRGYGARL